MLYGLLCNLRFYQLCLPNWKQRQAMLVSLYCQQSEIWRAIHLTCLWPLSQNEVSSFLYFFPQTENKTYMMSSITGALCSFLNLGPAHSDQPLFSGSSILLIICGICQPSELFKSILSVTTFYMSSGQTQVKLSAGGSFQETTNRW